MTTMNLDKAIIAVDVQRGFMPTAEGKRLHDSDGFGELGVETGEQIVAPLSQLLGWAALNGFNIATTQDWHPNETAHFAPEGQAPNFTTNWPRHCVDGTAGAELHPGLKVPRSATRFIKGTEVLERGEDDLSYSGYYAFDPTTDVSLPEWLKHRGVTQIAVGGLALDYCVGSTAFDFVHNGFDVTLLTDLTRAVAEPSGNAMLQKLEAAGVHLMTKDDYINQMAAIA